MVTIAHKRCYRCKRILILEFFYNNRSSKDGKSATCKDCTKAIQAERRKRQNTGTSRRCSNCGIVKPLSDFYRAYPYCKTCTKVWRRDYYEKNEKGAQKSDEDRKRLRQLYLKRNFNLSQEEYEGLLQQQDGVCAICGQPEHYINKGSQQPSFLAIDHCHQTGYIRELLCRSCNALLGNAHDDPEILRKAADYLEKHRQCN